MQKLERMHGKRFSTSRVTNRSRSEPKMSRNNKEPKVTVEESQSAPNTSWLSRGHFKTFYTEESFFENLRDYDIVDSGDHGAMVTTHGIITLRLRDRVRIDLTLDRAIRIVNYKNHIVLAFSATGSSSAVLHPNGKVFQYGSCVEILAHGTNGNKFAKMSHKGVSFTNETCAVVYLVDSAGTRTTTDTFSDLSQDFSQHVFYNESRHGPSCIRDAIAILHNSQYWMNEDGSDNWIINNIRISQKADGLVRVARNSNKFSLRTSPSKGSASVSSPFMHCTGSLGEARHLFVRRGERRMHYDGTNFVVRNAGHSAGFDDKQQLKVY